LSIIHSRRAVEARSCRRRARRPRWMPAAAFAAGERVEAVVGDHTQTRTQAAVETQFRTIRRPAPMPCRTSAPLDTTQASPTITSWTASVQQHGRSAALARDRKPVHLERCSAPRPIGRLHAGRSRCPSRPQRRRRDRRCRAENRRSVPESHASIATDRRQDERDCAVACVPWHGASSLPAVGERARRSAVRYPRGTSRLATIRYRRVDVSVGSRRRLRERRRSDAFVRR
jgi:hypothetical protein